jgi:hypothetical protein
LTRLSANFLPLGVAVALALKAALLRFNISGRISLLGTPGWHPPVSSTTFLTLSSLAEEGGAGKVILLDNGAYADMDVCMM